MFAEYGMLVIGNLVITKQISHSDINLTMRCFFITISSKNTAERIEICF